MAFKIISGTYSAGYSLGARITLVSITAAGLVEGPGVVAGHPAVIVNDGRIEDGAAALGASGYAGVDLAAGGRVGNSSLIDGGVGGAGGGSNLDGGSGGAGVLFGAAGTLRNKGTVGGGGGGTGANGNASQQAGAGGVGGAGLLGANGAVVVNFGQLSGGAGGRGGYNYQGFQGNGGDGGGGVELLGAGAVNNSGAILGGAGGASGHVYGLGGAVGGQGGDGVDAGGALTLSNRGVIRGGSASSSAFGGYGVIAQSGSIINRGLIAGGAGVGFYERGGAGARLVSGGSLGNLGTIQGGAGGYYGGQGADGVDVSGGASIARFTNSGVMTGGAGGDGERSTLSYGPTSGGAGGAGGDLIDATATNSGTITGGGGGAGGGGYSGDPGGAGGAGLELRGGDLTNSGRIVGGAGGAGGFGSAYGANGGAGGAGVSIDGVLINSGTILGGAGGAGGAAYIGGNQGNAGSQGEGVSMPYYGGLTNAAGGLISGSVGVDVGARRAMVVDAGTIAGVTAALVFHSAGDVLVLESGAKLQGAVIGGNGSVELSGGAGTLTNIGAGATVSGSVAATVSGFATYEIAGGQWAIAGVNSLAAYANLVTYAATRVTGQFDTNMGASIYAHAALLFSGVTGSFAGQVSGPARTTFFGGNQTFNGTGATGGFFFGDHVLLDHDTATLQGSVFAEGLTVTTGNLLIGAAGVQLTGGAVTLTDSAGNRITGAAGAMLANSARISGAGQLGAGALQLFNAQKGVIDATGVNALVIDTGAATIVNAGLIEASGEGGATIQSALAGSGQVEANGGVLTANGAVAATQSGVIAAGTLAFGASFAGAVSFTGANGVLSLAQSQGYTGAISGFAAGGGDKLDLRDIGFIGSGEGSFSGTSSQGVLTVTDGSHTARITLIGNYLGDVFTATSDGGGGTLVTAGPAATQRFAAATAALTTASGADATSISLERFAALSAVRLVRPAIA